MKRSAVAWGPWLQRHSDEAIKAHWAEFADDDVGFIVGDGFLVLDTDSAEATAALDELQERHSVSPGLTVSTARGEHHYFRLAEAVFVRSDSHSGMIHPERIDVKTGRSMVNLPPSGARTIKHRSVDHADQLTEVGQDFVDDVFRHNGRPLPRPAPERELLPVTVDDAQLSKVEALLNYIDPNRGYEDWNQILMAIFHATQGGDAGLDLADAWSARGQTYGGRREVEAKWRSYSLEVANPVTIGTLIKLAREAGADTDVIMGEAFEALSTPTEVVEPEQARPVAVGARTPLDRFSLRGCLDELKRKMVKSVFVLGALALLGQITIIFAAPSTGKTLIVLRLLIEALRANTIAGLRVYYLNLDDNLKGVHDKLELAEEYGFELITEDERGFKAPMLLPLLDKMAEDGTARNTVIIADTVKKFVNVMDKKEVTAFMAALRRFGMAQGTFIGLAHINKHRDANGKPIITGTSDLKDDADCAYLLDEIERTAATNEKVVEFENIKPRGTNALKATYAYTLDRDISYGELVMSVREVDPELFHRSPSGPQRIPDDLVIEVITACILEGVRTKTKLLAEVMDRAGIPRRAAAEIIDRNTGEDPAKHLWSFKRGGRGAYVYSLHGVEPTDPPAG